MLRVLYNNIVTEEKLISNIKKLLIGFRTDTRSQHHRAEQRYLFAYQKMDEIEELIKLFEKEGQYAKRKKKELQEVED